MTVKQEILEIVLTLFKLLLIIAISWAIFLLISWLITLCFGLEWNILIGTGVWLCGILLKISTDHKRQVE